MVDIDVFDSWLNKERISTNAYCHLINKAMPDSGDNYINGDLLISVVISTHNRAKELSKLIDSILSQTYRTFEIIIVDDGSTDDTETVVNDYVEKHSNTIVYHRNPVSIGVSRTKRKGYELASGDIVIFSDDDDYYIDDNFFSELVDTYQNKPDCVMAVAPTIDHFLIDDTYKLRDLNISSPVNNKDYLKGFLSKYKKPGSMLTLSFRATAMKRIDFDGLKCFNDMSFYLYGALAEGMVYPFLKAKAIYTRQITSMSSGVSSEYIIENLDAKVDIAQKAFDKGYIDDLEEWKYKQCYPTFMLFFSGKIKNNKEKKAVINWIKKNIGKPYRSAVLKEARAELIKKPLRKAKHYIKSHLNLYR